MSVQLRNKVQTVPGPSQALGQWTLHSVSAEWL
jgi:hypothetical protein